MPIGAPPLPPPTPAEVRPTRASCIAGAAQRYGANPTAIWLIIKVEGGTTGKIHRNADGTFDMGLMQINSDHLPTLAKFGIGPQDLIWNECLNIYIGTWYLQKNILHRHGDVWRGIGDYHSHTPSRNAAYQLQVYRALRAWQSEALAAEAGKR